MNGVGTVCEGMGKFTLRIHQCCRVSPGLWSLYNFISHSGGCGGGRRTRRDGA